MSPRHIKKEFRIVGLRRSGNHALVNWIARQSGGVCQFKNDVPPLMNPSQYHNTYAEKNAVWREDAAMEGNQNVDAFIYSYEDHRLNYVTHRIFEKNHDQWIGLSEKRVDVLILRDPFNLFASRMHSGLMQLPMRSMNLPDLWLSYAQEYLGHTNYLKNNKVVVNYNQWSSDRTYRHQVATRLGIQFTDDGFDEVPVYGGGSSFDGQGYQNKASQMNVLSRWNNLRDDETYRSLFRDPLLLDLACKIFELPDDLKEFLNKDLKPGCKKTAGVARGLRQLMTKPLSYVFSIRHMMGLNKLYE
jgi:hypothetical protein